MTENLNDFELVNQFLSGNEAAFNKIAVKYQERIYWHARRMTGNHPDADEIVQEVLLVIYEKLKTFKFKSSLYTWIFRITSTRCINLIRKNKVKRLFSLEDKSDELSLSPDFIKKIEDKEKLEHVNRALQKLPVKQREVFIMRNFEELSYEEIAAISGRSIGGLKANYFHAVNKLLELMKDEN
jgi:RNA polymerase sigma-70 factor (ECF subfamily)